MAACWYSCPAFNDPSWKSPLLVCCRFLVDPRQTNIDNKESKLVQNDGATRPDWYLIRTNDEYSIYIYESLWKPV